jgi:hypothetical protein
MYLFYDFSKFWVCQTSPRPQKLKQWPKKFKKISGFPYNYILKNEKVFAFVCCNFSVRNKTTVKHARMNLYFKLIGESMRKIWLRFSDPWWKMWHLWVFSHGTFLLKTPRIMLNNWFSSAILDRSTNFSQFDKTWLWIMLQIKIQTHCKRQTQKCWHHSKNETLIPRFGDIKSINFVKLVRLNFDVSNINSTILYLI